MMMMIMMMMMINDDDDFVRRLIGYLYGFMRFSVSNA